MKLTETTTTFTVTGICECDSCKGTGLYVGMAEQNGAAVVCTRCKGTGKVEVEVTYKKFVSRKKHESVERVYETAGGYGISARDYTDNNGKTIHYSRYGVSYEDWLNGATPLPIEELHCPYQHTEQRLQSNDVNNLYKKRCSVGLSLGSRIVDCEKRCDMAKCWKIYKGEK